MSKQALSSVRQAIKILMLLAFGAGCLMQVASWPSAAASTPTPEIKHALLHWEGQAHHHHEDGSLAADLTPESIHHVALDGHFSFIGVWPCSNLWVASQCSFASHTTCEPGLPSPIIDGPLKPPRTRS